MKDRYELAILKVHSAGVLYADHALTFLPGPADCTQPAKILLRWCWESMLESTLEDGDLAYLQSCIYPSSPVCTLHVFRPAVKQRNVT